VSGNSAGIGGGIKNGYGTLTVINSTVSGNSAVNGTFGGGGIENFGGTLMLKNSIIAGNTAAGSGPDILSDVAISSNARNFIGITSGIFGGVQPSDKTTATHGSINLGPLANNGGPTRTHALLVGSPAIDAGDNTAAAALTTDQRGTGFPRIVNSTVDIGAFESSENTPDLVIDLIGDVNSLSVKPAVKNALVVKLNAVLAALSVNDTATACARLQDFINYCRAQTGKKLPVPPDAGAALIAEATSIRTALHCP
jgi:hypothetical protein